jgi:hypothetical protein
MAETEFWAVIDEAAAKAKGSPKRLVNTIRERLVHSTREEVLEFNAQFNARLAEAYTWDLWGAGYLINGGCSDDGFHYFRGWVISLGRSAFESAVRAPDALAAVVDPKRDAYELEDLCSVACDAWEELTDGEDMPVGGPGEPAEPLGVQWDFDSDTAARSRLPALARLYVGEPDATTDKPRTGGFE